MATQKQIEANRRNAAKSSGPKTPQGKAKSSQNAVKHGLAASRKFDGNALLKVEHLAEALLKGAIVVSPPIARLVSAAEIELQQIRASRADVWSKSDARNLESASALVQSTTRIDRYERRAIFRRNKYLGQLMQNSVDK